MINAENDSTIVKMFQYTSWHHRDRTPLSTKSFLYMMGSVTEWQENNNSFKPICIMSKYIFPHTWVILACKHPSIIPLSINGHPKKQPYYLVMRTITASHLSSTYCPTCFKLDDIGMQAHSFLRLSVATLKSTFITCS